MGTGHQGTTEAYIQPHQPVYHQPYNVYNDPYYNPTVGGFNKGLSTFGLMNLADIKGTQINEFEAKKGSETMFDFQNGDPLANTNIDDMHMKAGASIDFNGATGMQEVGVMNRFEQGSHTRVMDAAKNANLDNLDHAGETLDDEWATLDIKNKAVDHAFSDAGIKVVLLI